MSAEMNPDIKLVREAVDKLGEHFDSVQIFVTRHEGDDGTYDITLGSGNWFARLGHVVQWLKKIDERERVSARREEDE